MSTEYKLPEPDFLPYPRQYVYEPSYSADQMHAAFAAGVEAGRKEERKRCCSIIFGQCGSDNVAQRTVDAIRREK